MVDASAAEQFAAGVPAAVLIGLCQHLEVMRGDGALARCRKFFARAAVQLMLATSGALQEMADTWQVPFWLLLFLERDDVSAERFAVFEFPH